MQHSIRRLYYKCSTVYIELCPLIYLALVWGAYQLDLSPDYISQKMQPISWRILIIAVESLASC